MREGFGIQAADSDTRSFPDGAALTVSDRAFVLLDGRPERSLGRALAWADRLGARELDVLADQATGVLARRAAEFAAAPRVWLVSGREVIPAEPDPPHEPSTPCPEALDRVGALVDADVEIVIEHGQVLGEVLGLEVARVVVDDGGSRVEVGVGRHDREAFAALHGHLPESDALDVVASTVRSRRRPGADLHPLARLAAERWLRALVVARPGLVGADDLRPVEATLARSGVGDVQAAPAVGTDVHGRPVVVVCSVGVDLDLVPSAADARAAHAPGAGLVLALPERDAVAVTDRLARALAEPATVVPLPDAWRSLPLVA